MNNFIDLTGQRFGLLVALHPTGRAEPTNGCLKWMCKCDCGNYHVVNSNNLRNKQVKSCGCLRRRKHEQNRN